LSFIRFDAKTDGSFSFGVDMSKIGASNAATGNISGDLGRLIRDLSAACEKSKTGIALFFDEAQDFLEEDLRAINILSHRANQECYRLVVAVAGLPTLPSRMAKTNSCSNRIEFYTF